jgi:hypothetical protein
MEMDMVVHCGRSTAGNYVHSLVLTDIVSGWTEAIAMVIREQTLVTESVSQVRSTPPFPVRGLDVDNDSARNAGGLLPGPHNRTYLMSGL